MKKHPFLNILIILSVFSMLAGYASATTQSGAEKITITKKPVSRNCKWRGKVSVVDESRSMSGQHGTLQEDEYNRLRNQASRLRANTVVLTPSSGMVDEKHWAGKAQHRTAATHIFEGNAYWCPNN